LRKRNHNTHQETNVPDDNNGPMNSLSCHVRNLEKKNADGNQFSKNLNESKELNQALNPTLGHPFNIDSQKSHIPLQPFLQ